MSRPAPQPISQSAAGAARRAVLVIAATDSSGGAGMTRDLETLTELDTPARCAVTAVTVQTNAQLRLIHVLPPELVRAQIGAALEGGGVGAIKIGMLGSAAAVQAVVDSLPARESVPIVLDPVLAATSGGALLDREGTALLLRLLVPRVTLLTPNLPEAAALLAEAPAMTDAARLAQLRALLGLGPCAVLLKGGHAMDAPGAAGAVGRVEDLLLMAGGEVLRLQTERVHARRRGTGCSASSAIAAHLAAARSLPEACAAAQAYVADALRRQTVAELPQPGPAQDCRYRPGGSHLV